MPKFKIGDELKLSYPPKNEFIYRVGHIGIVGEVNEFNNKPYYKLELYPSGITWWFEEDELMTLYPEE